MSAIRLLVLGAVRQHGRAHGYEVRNELEFWDIRGWSIAKPGSIYHALKQMAKQRLLLAHEIAPSTVGGPPRVEYEITDKGTGNYFTLLREALSSHDQRMDAFSSAIGFIFDLSRDDAVALLEQRSRGSSSGDARSPSATRQRKNRCSLVTLARSRTCGSTRLTAA